MTELGYPDVEHITEALRALVRRANRKRELRLTTGELDLLEAAARALEQVPDALRTGMETAFQLGREHGKKEELLDRLEREIAHESERLAREAWGKSVSPRPVQHSWQNGELE
jgi:hypothetical protein